MGKVCVNLDCEVEVNVASDVLQMGGPYRQSDVLVLYCLLPGLECMYAHPPLTPVVIVHSGSLSAGPSQ